jgi:hypothetical protein
MLIEYADLIEQLKQFRLDVIKALAEIDVEIDALHNAVVSSNPINPQALKGLRADSRKRLGKFGELYGQELALLHERR